MSNLVIQSTALSDRLLVLYWQSAFFEFFFRAIDDNVVNCLLTLIAVTRQVILQMLSELKVVHIDHSLFLDC